MAITAQSGHLDQYETLCQFRKICQGKVCEDHIYCHNFFTHLFSDFIIHIGRCSFEDYFVNGVRYEKHNTLLLGCPGKRKHMSILGEYYGRMRPTGGLLSWSQINALIASMFSKDYGGIRKETLSFYGNDPVCVFKYL